MKINHPLGTKSADECDAFGRWRYILCCMGRAGVVKKTKRSYWKRVRQAARKEIRDEH